MQNCSLSSKLMAVSSIVNTNETFIKKNFKKKKHIRHKFYIQMNLQISRKNVITLDIEGLGMLENVSIRNFSGIKI